ncbi:MAG TPA: hypothetical protein VGA20_10520 [Gemmatimonadales bacterium]
MPPHLRRFFATLSFGFFLIAAVPLFRQLTRRPDIWWTPRPLLVPLAQGLDRVEVYARGEPLVALLEAGQVRLVEGGGSTSLTANDVGFRFNNWDRIRAQGLPMLLASAAACGGAAVLFLLVITGRLAYRGEVT